MVKAGTETAMVDMGLKSEVNGEAPRVRACSAKSFGMCYWHMRLERLMSDQRHVRLFRKGRNQAVRIPVEFELPGNEAIMHRDGDRLVIEPVRKRGLIALLAAMKPLDGDFPEIEDRPPPAEIVF